MQDLIEIFEQFKDRAIVFLPKLAVALCILLAGWILAALLRSIAKTFIGKASDFAQKRFHALPGPLSRVPWALCGVIPNILYALAFILTLSIVSETLDLPLLTNWLNQITSFLPQAIAAALLVIAGFIGGSWLRGIAEEAIANSNLPHRKAVGISIQTMTAIVSVVVGIDLLGVDLSFVTTTFYIILASVAATIGLSFALGSREMVSNIVACYLLSSDYKPGVRVRLGSSEGVIVRISNGYVQMETADGLVALPGAQFSKEASILVKETPYAS